MKKFYGVIFGLILLLIPTIFSESNRKYFLLIIFPVLSLLIGIDAYKEYKNKEMWRAEKQLKTWNTGKKSHIFFKAFLSFLFLIFWVANLYYFIKTGEMLPSIATY